MLGGVSCEPIEPVILLLSQEGAPNNKAPTDSDIVTVAHVEETAFTSSRMQMHSRLRRLRL